MTNEKLLLPKKDDTELLKQLKLELKANGQHPAAILSKYRRKATEAGDNAAKIQIDAFAKSLGYDFGPRKKAAKK